MSIALIFKIGIYYSKFKCLQKYRRGRKGSVDIIESRGERFLGQMALGRYTLWPKDLQRTSAEMQAG